MITTNILERLDAERKRLDAIAKGDYFNGLDIKGIRTSYVCPPIPMPQLDWSACMDGSEEDGPYGSGATEAEAIADLKEIMWGEGL